MRFEDHHAVLEPENRFEDETGGQFEEHMVPPVDSNWDGKKWRGAGSQRETLLFKWMKENILSEMSEDEIHKTLDIPKVSPRNPRRVSTLNEQRILSAWARLDREKRREVFAKWVKNNQPEEWNPESPVRKNESGVVMNLDMSSIHSKVAEALEEIGVGPEVAGSLKLYSSLRTPLDDIAGVDAFFDCRGVVVTLDFTKNKLKSEYGLGSEKADIPITDIDMSSEEGKERLAQSIAKIIKDRLEKREVASRAA
jgi:hypothetical protein